MAARSHLGKLITLSSACLALGATTVSAGVSPPLSASSFMEATPAAGDDGFMQTTRSFQSYKQRAVAVETVLQQLSADTATIATDIKSKQPTPFQQKLSEKYPGAAFDGGIGTIPLQTGLVANFNGAMKVYRIKEADKNGTREYLITQRRIQLTSGVNSLAILVDQTTPANSLFFCATIPAVRKAAEKILTDPELTRVALDSVETSILNDAYQLLSMTNKVSMDSYGANVIHDATAQKEMLRVVATGYRDRHPEEYQKGAPQQKIRLSAVNIQPDKQADSRFYNGFIKTALFTVLAACALWLIYIVTRFMKSMSLSPVERTNLDHYNSLSPMVTASLKRKGATLWGKNSLLTKVYHLYKHKNRWVLCDGREDKTNNLFQAHHRVEVCLRGTYIKLQITRLNGNIARISLVTKGLTKIELDNKLDELCLALTNPITQT